MSFRSSIAIFTARHLSDESMKNLLLWTLGIFLPLFSIQSNAQVFYTEDFDGATTWTLNTDIGAEGANPNLWYISCEEEGVGAGACGTACGAGNKTLHVSTNITDLGAAYIETGTGATTTERRAESADISTVGYTNIDINYDFIGFGGNPSDYAELFYSTDGGGTWNSLATPLYSLCCGAVACDGTLQGLWQTQTFTLPATCEGIPNLRLSFVWKNTDDGTATDPSFAVDNITLDADIPPCFVNADFAPAKTNLCKGECISVTDLSTGPVTGWTWTYEDPAVTDATGPSPPATCWDNPGVWDITLEVTDGTCTDDTTITITVYDDPTIGVLATPNDSICSGATVTLSGTGASSYTWTGGVTDGIAFNPPATATYTVTGTSPFGCTGTADVTVVVSDCEPLVAGFKYPDPVCQGDCIELTDTTSGDPISWAWDFGGAATPNTSTEQNPIVCFNDLGMFDIQLTVTDSYGQSASVTNQITVYDAPEVSAWGDTIIDLGGEAILIADDTIGGMSYMWTPAYYVDCDTCEITTVHPQFDTVYTVTITDVNGCQDTAMVVVKVNFVEGIGVPSAFSPDENGINDVLYVKGIGITHLNFAVYNRYGQKVFESQDQNIGWDGNFHGKPEDPGVFIWVVEYTFVNGASGTIKGNTTLIR